MTQLRHALPATNQESVAALYGGDIFQLPPTSASRQLVTEAKQRVAEVLGEEPREAQFRLTEDEFFTRVGQLRRLIYTTTPFHRWVESLVLEGGFDVERIAYDPIRLRVISHKGHENPKAAPIYHAHRDTWYAHSQAEITWWIPLHGVTEEETFVFYPDYFARPVPNNSEQFDHDAWTSQGQSLRIGWQNAQHGATHLYPGQVGELDPGRVVTFAAREAEVVLFAGSHFHQTRKNGTGRTRFSLDFRTVDLDDHEAGRGAPNVDNRSTGSAVRDYVRRGAVTA
jgi:hypothetical protein